MVVWIIGQQTQPAAPDSHHLVTGVDRPGDHFLDARVETGDITSAG
jgi:hypothetical protein